MSQAKKSAELSQAIERGQLWRAKEILSGRIGTLPFDADLYEQFGALLLRMGDDVQAGRFLFLSGRRRPEYQAVIDLFLSKHIRGGRGHLFFLFPVHMRRRPWSELPEPVRQELEALKFGPAAEDRALWAKLRVRKDDTVSTFGCVMALLIIVGLGILLSVFIVYFYY